MKLSKFPSSACDCALISAPRRPKLPFLISLCMVAAVSPSQSDEVKVFDQLHECDIFFFLFGCHGVGSLVRNEVVLQQLESLSLTFCIVLATQSNYYYSTAGLHFN